MEEITYFGIEYSTIAPKVEIAIESVNEPGLKDLLDEAVALCKQPNPTMRNYAVEKIWDALERLKTYYTTLDKKASATKIVADVSGGQSELEQLFDTEFGALTKIGNDYFSGFAERQNACEIGLGGNIFTDEKSHS